MVRHLHVLLAGLCVACGGTSTPIPTSPTPVPANNFNGTWTGGSETPIRLVIEDGVLTSFGITFTRNLPDVGPCTNTYTMTPGVSIANSTFSFFAAVPSDNERFTPFTGPVTGTFATGTSGSVTIGRAGSTGFGHLPTRTVSHVAPGAKQYSQLTQRG